MLGLAVLTLLWLAASVSAAPLSFAVIGDLEAGRRPVEKVFAKGADLPTLLERVAKEGQRPVLMLGDFVELDAPQDFEAYRAELGARLQTPVWQVAGNHGGKNSPSRLYRETFGKTSYYHDRGGARFVVLDNANGALTFEQNSWLSKVLQTKLRKFVFLHLPPSYLKGELEAPGNTFEIAGWTGYFSEGDAMFGEIVSSFKVDRVYIGHSPVLAHADHEGVRYVLTAGGGAPHYNLPPGLSRKRVPHFIETTVGPGGVTDRVVPLHGPGFELR
jgi:hypothetical protein